jgi:hypothetical protein
MSQVGSKLLDREDGDLERQTGQEGPTMIN